MSREKEFNESCKEFCGHRQIGMSELQSFYLHEIALHLAIIADCLEDKKVRKDVDSD